MLIDIYSMDSYCLRAKFTVPLMETVPILLKEVIMRIAVEDIREAFGAEETERVKYYLRQGEDDDTTYTIVSERRKLWDLYPETRRAKGFEFSGIW